MANSDFVWKKCERCRKKKADYSIRMGLLFNWWLCEECFNDASSLMASFVEDFQLEVYGKEV